MADIDILSRENGTLQVEIGGTKIGIYVEASDDYATIYFDLAESDDRAALGKLIDTLQGQLGEWGS